MPTLLRPRIALAAPLLALPLLLAGCSGGETSAAPSGSPSASSATPSAAPSSKPTTPANGKTYVALGDSYTAAPFVPRTDASENSNGCLRSDSNYPHLVAAELGFSLGDVSCSGATSASLIGIQQTPTSTLPAQFDALDKDTDLVTVGIGGNDGELFASLIQSCLAPTDGTDGDCSSTLTAPERTRLLKLASQLQPRIAAVVNGVRDRSPDAQIIVVGYPQLVPDQGTCEALPLPADDYPFARKLNMALSDAVLAGAKEEKAELVDVYALSKGHDICSDSPWVNGAVTDPSAALAYHPFAVEQQAIATAVEALVAEGGKKSA